FGDLDQSRDSELAAADSGAGGGSEPVFLDRSAGSGGRLHAVARAGPSRDMRDRSSVGRGHNCYRRETWRGIAANYRSPFEVRLQPKNIDYERDSHCNVISTAEQDEDLLSTASRGALRSGNTPRDC